MMTMVICLAGVDDYEGAAGDDSSKLVVDHLHVDLVALVQPVEDEEHLVPVVRPLHQVHLLLLLHLFKIKNHQNISLFIRTCKKGGYVSAT